MVKGILFGLALLVAPVVAGAAAGNAGVAPRVDHSTDMVWNVSGNRLSPHVTPTTQRVAQPTWFPSRPEPPIEPWWFGSYRSPVDPYDWSHFLDWVYIHQPSR